MNQNETINLPVKVTYRIVDGKPVRIDEERADIPLQAFTSLFVEAFHAHIREQRNNAKHALFIGQAHD